MSLASTTLAHSHRHRRRRLQAPYATLPYGHSADVWWEGNVGSLTQVAPTGSVTLTEREGFLSAKYTGQADLDVGCILKAHTFSTGDIFATHIRNVGRSEQTYSMAFVVVTDGTSTTSNVVAAMVYEDSARVSAWHGTLTSLATNPWTQTNVNNNHSLGGIYLAVEYVAANSFNVRASADGVSWTAFGNAAFAKTMTPTHFGVGWSKWNGAGEAVSSYGPICKVA